MKKGVNIDVDEWLAEANALEVQAEVIRLVDPAMGSEHEREDELNRRLRDDDDVEKRGGEDEA